MSTFAPIHIGPVEIADPVLLAPMSGVSDLPFRRLVKSWGAGMVFSEMIASDAMVRQVKGSLKIATDCAEEFPMAVQLVGYDPAVMAEAARIAADRGAAVIDINLQPSPISAIADLFLPGKSGEILPDLARAVASQRASS